MGTKIEWTDETWNPVTGCSPITAGCENCYAARMAATRLRDHPRYTGLARMHNGRPCWTGQIALHEDVLERPLRWRKPRRVFVVSMGDLFHRGVPTEFFTRVLDVIAQCPQHTFQLLTKRPERMLQLIRKKEDSHGQRFDYLFPNVWLGVTVESESNACRIPLLLQTPAARRFVSCEPLLGPIDLDGYLGSLLRLSDNDGHIGDGLDWVICGAETGPRARTMNTAWALSLRDQCQAADVPFFFKRHSDGGRLLDGRTWDEMPQGEM